jgi:hypothetical protein
VSLLNATTSGRGSVTFQIEKLVVVRDDKISLAIHRALEDAVVIRIGGKRAEAQTENTSHFADNGRPDDKPKGTKEGSLSQGRIPPRWKLERGYVEISVENNPKAFGAWRGIHESPRREPIRITISLGLRWRESSERADRAGRDLELNLLTSTKAGLAPDGVRHDDLVLAFQMRPLLSASSHT